VTAQRLIYAQRDRLTSVWAKGHRGEPLNEGVDAFARLASRYATGTSELTKAEYHRGAARRGTASTAFAERVRRAQARIINEHNGENVLVASHVTPIKALLRMALDAGPGILYRLHLDLAPLSVAEFYPDGVAAVRLVNQTA
jgi:broad specificity phosphatase PhoE